MKCGVCPTGELKSAKRTVTHEVGETVVVVRGTPGYVCDTCGAGYTDPQVTDRLLAIARDAAARGMEVAVCHYTESEPSGRATAR